MKRCAPLPALCTLALVASTTVPAAAAAEKLQDILDAAGKSYVAGQKCLSAGRKNPKSQFIENEKAIGHLEQSQRLLDRYLTLKPDDVSAERMMQDVSSLLFWCHKMSPMVDPEEIEQEDPDEVEDEPEPEPSEDPEEAKRKAEEAAAAKAEEEAKLAEEEAKTLLEQARQYREENPKDGMGALAKFFMVAERFPESEAGQTAKSEAEKLQESLFAVKLVVPKKPKKLPALTKKDEGDITATLKSWLLNRQKVRCASCKGEGYSQCRKCKGTGKIRGRAGRKSTCTKCRRGKVKCKRGSCTEGIDTRMLTKVVIQSRAPYYQEKLKALLGEGKKAVPNFIEALAATLADSPQAPAVISRKATELGIAPVQLRDVIDAHGPGPQIVAQFSTYSLGKIKRKVTYNLKGDEPLEETVTVEQQDGKWYVRKMH